MGLPLIYRPNPFAYPGRAPGFDPTHPAAQNIRFSCVHTGGSLFSTIFGGGKGAFTGSASNGIDGYIGPNNNFTNTSQLWSGKPSNNDLAITLAMVVINTGSAFLYLSNSNNTAGVELRVTSALVLGVTGIGSSTSGITLTSGFPYFLAASANLAATTNNINFIAVNLKTGQIQTATTSATLTPSAPSGTFGIGGSSASTAAKVAAAMISGVYLSKAQLLQWAADPWAFWYPRTQSNLMFAGLGGQQAGPAAGGLPDCLPFQATVGQLRSF